MLKASRGSSIFNFSSSFEDAQHRAPPIAPTGIAIAGFSTAHGAVTDTKAARTPLQIEGTFQIPLVYRPKEAITIPPEAAARVVFTATFEASSIAPAAAKVDPQLNPYHPNHRIRVPIACIGTL